MHDLLFLAVSIAFFAVGALIMKGLERL